MWRLGEGGKVSCAAGPSCIRGGVVDGPRGGRGHTQLQTLGLLLFGPGRSRSCNVLLMWRHNASLPRAAYGPSKLLGCQRWRHSQAGQFTHQYLPDIQRCQKRRTPMADLTTDQTVMVVDPQPPLAHSKGHRSSSQR